MADYNTNVSIVRGANTPGYTTIPLVDGEVTTLIKSLRNSNELYDDYAKHWAFYLSAYEGGADFTDGRNLFKHVRETPSDYDDRILRAHNMNYCEPLVDFFTNFIFAESIDRNGGSNSDFYNTFITDVNLKGESVDTFMRTVSDDDQIFGMTYVIVDTPAFEGVVSKLDEQNKGIRPYWVSIKPDEVRDWVVDDFGVYSYIKRCQLQRNMVGGQARKLEKYTEFYPDYTKVTVLDVTNPNEVFVSSGPLTKPNPLGEIPIVVARYKRSKKNPEMGLSFLRDFAYNNREILNLTSLLQEFLYRQCFNVLAMEKDSTIPAADQQEGSMGTSNLMEYPLGAKEPKYISPPADPAKFIQDERARIKNEMFVRAAQDALNELFNGEKASGFSQAQSFSKTVPFISSRADELERVENALMRLTMKWLGKDWDGKIKYKDRYELTNLSDAMGQFQILVRDLQVPSEIFVKSELKRLVHEFDGKLTPDDVIKIDKQIDSMNFTDWQATQKDALVGKAASLGAKQNPNTPSTLTEAAQEAKSNNSPPNTSAVKNK